MSCNFNVSKIIKKIKCITHIKTKPTITFYLSLFQNNKDPDSINSTTFNQINIGSTNKLQSSISPIYYDYDLKKLLGKSSSSVTLYDYKKPNFDNLYYSSVTTVYRLLKGNIGISHAPQLQKFENFYGLPENIIEIAPITFGTGDYLNCRGFVAIVTGDSTTKLILIYI